MRCASDRPPSCGLYSWQGQLESRSSSQTSIPTQKVCNKLRPTTVNVLLYREGLVTVLPTGHCGLSLLQLLHAPHHPLAVPTGCPCLHRVRLPQRLPGRGRQVQSHRQLPCSPALLLCTLLLSFLLTSPPLQCQAHTRTLEGGHHKAEMDTGVSLHHTGWSCSCLPVHVSEPLVQESLYNKL